MEQVFAKAEELTGQLKDYVALEIEDMKLVAVQKGSKIVGNIAAMLVAVMMALFFIIFGGIALGIYIGECLGSLPLGFLIVAAGFMLIGLIVWLARKSLIQLPVMNNMIKQLCDHEED